MSELSRKRLRASRQPSRLYTTRRRAMIKAAADVFRQKGLADTSLQDVSALIGVERASLYYYFGSKEQLFRAVILESTEQVVARARAISAGSGTVRERLTAVITHIVSSFAEHYPLLHVFVQEDMRRVTATRTDAQSRSEQRRLAELADQYMATLETLIEEGITNGEFRGGCDAHLAGYVIQGALNWMHRWFKPGPTTDPAAIADLFVTILLDGLADPSAPAASTTPRLTLAAQLRR